MKSNTQGFLTKALMLTLVVFMALPAVALGQGRGKGRDKQKDVFVNGHDARDGRTDGRGPRRDDQRRRDRRRDYDDDDQYRRDDRYRRDDQYRRDQYGYNGQLRQTALNAGYNEGVREGRHDRDRGDRFDYRDEGAYRSASKDYNSRLGDRNQYQQFFRQGFANGYRDGYNGY